MLGSPTGTGKHWHTVGHPGDDTVTLVGADQLEALELALPGPLLVLDLELPSSCRHWHGAGTHSQYLALTCPGPCRTSSEELGTPNHFKLFEAEV